MINGRIISCLRLCLIWLFFVTFRSSGLFNVMQKTVEAYHDNDDLCGTMLKCLIAFV